MSLRKSPRHAFVLLLILSVTALAALVSSRGSASPAVADWRAKVDPLVLEKAALGGQVEFFAYMGRQADLSGASALRTKEEKGSYVYESLTAAARESQPGVLQALSALGVEHKSFWVTNAIYVKGDLAAIQAVASLPEVAAVYPSGTGALQLPPQEEAASSTEAEGGAVVADSAFADPSPEPGLLRVRANEVWAMGIEGRGVVVAGADTGVFWEHSALKGKYRGWDGAAANHSYNWHDAIKNPNTGCAGSTTAPCDDDVLLGGGHGTHTVGTMVGDDGGNNRVGMAPEAKWVACRNMNNGVGVVPTYLECMEWFIAPTDINNANPDPSKAPHVINNSWGCVEGCAQPLLQDPLRASRAAGIIYVVSAGNDGPECNTLQFPLARYPEAFTVGSTTHGTDVISSFSSRGTVLGDPTAPLGLVKPNISAPGSSVRSALRNGGYGSLSGTSMAGPHVAGLVALVISANPKLAGEVDRVEDIIEATAARKTTTEGCGGDTSSTVPNNVYGWGRIDAFTAVLDALPPDAVDDDLTMAAKTSLRFDVLANDTDPDGDTLAVGAVGAASHGTVTNNGDGTLTYTPAADFSGTDTFTYTACAPEGCEVGGDTATVTVVVKPPFVNYALASEGSKVLASSTYKPGNYSPAGVINGDLRGLLWSKGGGWKDATANTYPDFIEITFNGLKPLTQVRVTSLQDDPKSQLEPTPGMTAGVNGVLDYTVLYRVGTQWVTLGSVTDNAFVLSGLSFPEVRTNKIRVVFTRSRSPYTKVIEVEAFGPSL
ncbi:MAG TPA: S8 family serine peptidase [Pyrinomonadaceae bacterium]|nr:S8 family serine peptidase [Pyrinomonadaceae bacterium]